MVVVRMARGGSRSRPFYRIVAADRRAPLKGRFIERLGFYNPIARGGELCLNFNSERYEYWIAQGAQSSSRVRSLYKLFSKNDLQPLQARFERISKAPREQERSVAKLELGTAAGAGGKEAN